MRLRVFLIRLFLLLFCGEGLAQQTGDMDTNFRISRNGVLAGTVYKVLVQPDQKVLAFGNFTGIGTWQSPYLLRFHPDGWVDTTFRSPFWVGQQKFSEYSVFNEGNGPQLLEDGKLLVSGQFDSVGADSLRGIVLLKSDGTIDYSFRAYKIPFSSNKLFDRQQGAYRSESGKIYTLFFFNYQNWIYSTVARLSSSGDWDTTFQLSSPMLLTNYAVKITSLRNGKMFLHNYYPCAPCPPDDGPSYFGTTLTDSGQINYIPNGGWRWVQEDTSGNLYGFMSNEGWTTPNYLFLRYNQNNQSLHAASLSIIEIENGELMDDKEMITFDYSHVRKIIKIDSVPFALSIGNANAPVLSLARTPSNQVYLAGAFTQYNGQPGSKLIRIHNFKTILGTEPVREAAIRLYPNPVSGSFVTLENTVAAGRVTCTNRIGSKVLDLPIFGKRTQLDVSSLAGGIYSITLFDAFGKRQRTEKLAVVR